MLNRSAEVFLLAVLLSGLSWAQSPPGLPQPQLPGDIIAQAEELTNLLENIEKTQEEQRQRYEALDKQLADSKSEITLSKQAITDLKSITAAQGTYLRELLERQKESQKIYEAQLSYQKRLETRSKRLTVSLIIAVPAAVLAGGIAAWVLRGK